MAIGIIIPLGFYRLDHILCKIYKTSFPQTNIIRQKGIDEVYKTLGYHFVCKIEEQTKKAINANPSMITKDELIATQNKLFEEHEKYKNKSLNRQSGNKISDITQEESHKYIRDTFCYYYLTSYIKRLLHLYKVNPVILKDDGGIIALQPDIWIAQDQTIDFLKSTKLHKSYRNSVVERYVIVPRTQIDEVFNKTQVNDNNQAKQVKSGRKEKIGYAKILYPQLSQYIEDHKDGLGTLKDCAGYLQCYISKRLGIEISTQTIENKIRDIFNYAKGGHINNK